MQSYTIPDSSSAWWPLQHFSQPLTIRWLQGLLCYSIVMGFMFAIADLPEVQVAIAQPLVPALALGMSAVAGTETLSWVAGLGIVCSIGGVFRASLSIVCLLHRQVMLAEMQEHGSVCGLQWLQLVMWNQMQGSL